MAKENDLKNAVNKAVEKFKSVYHNGDFKPFDFEYCIIDLAKECREIGAQATRNQCDKEMKCSQHIGTIEDCKEYAVMCYQCHLKRMAEFEKAVRNDQKEVLKKWNTYPQGRCLEFKEWLEESCKHEFARNSEAVKQVKK